MYSEGGALTSLGQQPQTPEWYNSLQTWFSQWSQRMQQISNILTETPNMPAYAQTGQQVTQSQQTFVWWMQQPFTWVALGALAFTVYKLRTAE